MRISGELVPDGEGRGPTRLHVAKGRKVHFSVLLQNTGTLTFTPFYWIRVHHAAAVAWSYGDKIKDWEGHLRAVRPEEYTSIEVEFVDDSAIGWRDVAVDVFARDNRQDKLAAESWRDAYAVELPKVEIQGLVLTRPVVVL